MSQVQILSFRPYRVFITDFSYGHSIFLCLHLYLVVWSSVLLLFFLSDCVGRVFDCHALTRVEDIMRSQNDAGDVEPADEAVVDDNALCSALTCSFHGKDLDLLDKLSQEYRS